MGVKIIFSYSVALQLSQEKAVITRKHPCGSKILFTKKLHGNFHFILLILKVNVTV